jgi:hypothetical protein
VSSLSYSISALDLTKVPFGKTKSSYLVFEENDGDGEGFKPGLYFASSAQSAEVRRKGLVDIVPIHNGEPLSYTYNATPSVLRLDTARGSIQIIMDTSGTMRIRGQGVGVRLYTEIPFMTMMLATQLPNGIVDLNLIGIRPGGGRFFFVPIEGRVTLDSVYNVVHMGPEDATVELLPSERGYFETAVYAVNPDEWGTVDYQPMEACIAQTDGSFRDFLASYPDIDGKWSALRELCAYTVWLHYQEKSAMAIIPTMKADMIYRSRFADCEAKAFEQPLHAMALSDAQAAFDLISNIFAHMENGMLPTAVSNSRIYYQAFLPVHGAAVLHLLDLDFSGIPEKALKALYISMSEHYAWWVKSHSLSENHFSYNQRDEYGFSGSSYGALTFPLETPELYAFMILYTEALSKLSAIAGDGKKDAWAESSGRLMTTLMSLWDGDCFVCRDAYGGRRYTSGSLLAYLPVILGRRLPAVVLEKLRLALGDEEGFLCSRGFRSESKRSPYYDATVSGRGAVDASLQVLVTGGLFDTGAIGLAREAAARFLAYAEANGARDIIVSEGQEPPRRPADEMNAMAASAVLCLGGKLHRGGRE